jgi:hypothetical protein
MASARLESHSQTSHARFRQLKWCLYRDRVRGERRIKVEQSHLLNYLLRRLPMLKGGRSSVAASL